MISDTFFKKIWEKEFPRICSSEQRFLTFSGHHTLKKEKSYLWCYKETKTVQQPGTLSCNMTHSTQESFGQECSLRISKTCAKCSFYQLQGHANRLIPSLQIIFFVIFSQRFYPFLISSWLPQRKVPLASEIL